MIGHYRFGAAAEAASLRSFASRDLVIADPTIRRSSAQAWIRRRSI
jgi:hypothetical protein